MSPLAVNKKTKFFDPTDCLYLTVASFTLPFACGDPAPILRTLQCVKLSDA